MSTNPEPMPAPAGSSATPALFRLLCWLSPAFPTGAFSYSHGLEAVCAAGKVHDRKSLEAWIAAIIERGSGRIDADILRDAYRAALAGDDAALRDANRRGAAFRATAELALESAQQGEAFVAAHEAAWAFDEQSSPPVGGEGRVRGAARAPTSRSPQPSPPVGEREAASATPPRSVPRRHPPGSPWRMRLRAICRPSPAIWYRPGCGSGSSARPTGSAFWPRWSRWSRLRRRRR